MAYSCATTNDRINVVCNHIRTLIDWATVDAQHASENDAPDTAKDDRKRAKLLQQALDLIEQTRRD